MLKYTLILLVNAVMAQNSTTYNSTNLNSTAPMQQNATLLPACSISMTCDQVLKKNGQNTTGGANCYEIYPYKFPQNANKKQKTITDAFKLPNSYMSSLPEYSTRCMTQQALESGFGGMFSYTPQTETYDYQYDYKIITPQGWYINSTDTREDPVQFGIKQVSYSQKQYENGQMMSDHYNSEVLINKGETRIMTMTQKIQDYLFFSMLQGDVNANSTDITNCAQSCGKDQFVQKCCAAVNMMSTVQGMADNGAYTYTDMKEFTYMCVDQAVAPGANVNMNVGDMTVSISCVDSGAQKLTMVVVSALAALFTLV